MRRGEDCRPSFLDVFPIAALLLALALVVDQVAR